jgi:septum formation protein
MKPVPKIILASRSPRRSDLLRQMGFQFEVRSKEISESSVTAANPVDRVIQLSRKKAEAVLDEAEAGLIVGADTIVCIDKKIFGKPHSSEEAKSMLQSLSGKTHEVFTGFTILEIGGGSVSDYEKTKVTFRKLEDWEVEDYVNSGEPLDKAGAYGIQDRSGLFVDRIEGCFYNVVGFPLTRFYESLKKLFDRETIQKLFDHTRG